MSEGTYSHRDLIVYQKSFVAGAEAEAAETQVWVETHRYLEPETSKQANDFYDEILRMIVKMIDGSANWSDLKGKEAGLSERAGESESQGILENEETYSARDEYVVIDQQALLVFTPARPISPTPHLPDSPSLPISLSTNLEGA